MMRVAVVLAVTLAASRAGAQTWNVGDPVLASPTMNANWWMVCVVKSPPTRKSQGYVLNCAKAPSKEESLRTVPSKWIRSAPSGVSRASPSPESSASPTPKGF